MKQLNFRDKVFILNKIIDGLKKDIQRPLYYLFMAMPRLYRKPTRLIINVTERCNSRCITCNTWKKNDKKDLPKKYIFKFVDEALKFSGPKTVTLSGGEPLLRKDIYDIVKYISTRKDYVQILTNGILLNEKTIGKLVESRVSYIYISLNGIDPKIHDYSRGVNGNLNKIFSAVDYIKKNHPNLRIEFVMLIYKQNLDQIVPAIEYANDVGAYINFQPIQPIFRYSNYENGRKNSTRIFQRLLPDDFGKLSLILNQIKIYKAKGYRIWLPNSFLKSYLDYFKNQGRNKRNKCKIGFASMILCNNGDIKLCHSYSPIGNIMQCNLKDLWISKVAKEKRKQMLKCKKNCVFLCNLTPNLMDIFTSGLSLVKGRILDGIYTRKTKD